MRLPDSTLPLRLDPYGFVSRRARAEGRDAFRTRLLLRPALCLTGPEAGELFYDEARVTRVGAAPEPLQRTLFGKGGIQGLDGTAHRTRKAAFQALRGPESVAALVEAVDTAWESRLDDWVARGEVVLYDEMLGILTAAACRWAGAPLPTRDVVRRTQQLTLLFDAASGVGPRHLLARRARVRLEDWAAGLVEDVRSGRRQAPEGSALALVAVHEEEDGHPLPARVAGVELLNVIRPTVAVAVFICHVAHALAAHPQWRERLRRPDSSGSGDAARWFVEEVRRCYPFFPAVTGRARTELAWQGCRARPGERLLFDLDGTNHDPRAWERPEEFDPGRWARGEPSPYAHVPQGGGDPAVHHRCPGEPLTVALMELAVDVMVRRLDWQAADASMGLAMRRVPALPRNRFVISGVRRVHQAAGA